MPIYSMHYAVMRRVLIVKENHKSIGEKKLKKIYDHTQIVKVLKPPTSQSAFTCKSNDHSSSLYKV